MPISGQQIALIQTSFERIRKNAEPHSLYFYEALFRHAPQFRSMFREDLAGQGMQFMSTLSVILDNLEHPDAIEDRYTELGRTHAILGVKAADFEPMEEALIDTMRNALGAEFTVEHEEAWRAAFEEVGKTMIEKGGIPSA